MVLGSVPSTTLIWRDLTNIFLYVFSANYTLPEESKKADPEKEGDKDEISPFKEIIFTELQREEAATIVAEYNKVCKNQLLYLIRPLKHSSTWFDVYLENVESRGR